MEFRMQLTPLRVLTYVYPCLSVVGQYPLGTVGGVPLSLERVALLLLGPLCLVQVFAGGENARRIVRYTPGIITAGLGLWLIALALSCVLHFAPGDTALLWGYGQKFLLGFLFACAVAAEPDALRAVRLFAVTSLVATVATFYVYVTQGSAAIRSGAFVSLEYGDVTLLEGVARAGANGSVPLMACWLQAVFARRGRLKLAWYVGVAALFVAAMLALRREYLLSIGVCMLWGVYSLPLGVRRFTAVFVVGGFLALGVGVIHLVPEWRQRLFSETVDSLTSGQDLRLLMLQTAPKLFVEEPLAGHGLGTFPFLMATSLPVHLATDEETNRFLARGLASHNSFLTAGLETGLLGLVGLVALFGGLGLWSVRIWRNSRMRGGSALAMFAPLFFIQIFFGVFFQDGLASNIIWAFMGMLIAIVAIERSKGPGPRPGRQRPGQPGHLRRGPETLPPSHVRNRRMG